MLWDAYFSSVDKIVLTTLEVVDKECRVIRHQMGENVLKQERTIWTLSNKKCLFLVFCCKMFCCSVL